MAEPPASPPASPLLPLYRLLTAIDRHLNRAIRWLLVLIVAAMVAIVVLQVVARFLLIPIIWTSEATQNLKIWLTFVGGAAAFAQGEHVAVELLVARVRPSLRAAIGLLVHLALLAFFFVFALYGWRLAVINLSATGYTLPISQFYVTLAVPVGMALVSLSALARIAGILAGEVPKPSDPVESAQ